MAKVYFYDAEGNRVELDVNEDIRDGYADIIRKQRRRDDYEQYHSVSLDAITDAGHEFRDDTYNPERMLIEREDETKLLKRLERLKIAMAELPPGQKKIIHKIFFEGMTQEAIGKELGISQQAVAKRLKKVFLSLKKKII